MYNTLWKFFFIDQNDDEGETKEEKSFAESEAVEQDEGWGFTLHCKLVFPILIKIKYPITISIHCQAVQ